MERTRQLMVILGLGMIACGGGEPVLDSANTGTRGRDTGTRVDEDVPDEDQDEDDGSDVPALDAGRRDAGIGGARRDAANDSCETLDVVARPSSPDILIVLDRSGSMAPIGGGTNRWVPSARAVETLTSQLTETVAFGLMTFPSLSSGNACAPGRVDVPIATGSASQIASVLSRAAPNNGSTPTAATLDAALAALNVGPCVDCVEVPKYVLLVTDGEPTCGSGGFTESTAETIAATTASIDRLTAAGVKTYVVGYGTASDPKASVTMDQFAQHGGTGRHLPVENETSLVNELTRIAGSLVPCEYELDGQVGDPRYVRVTIDGTQHNLSDGAWRLDGKKIVLEGACRVLRDAKVHQLKIVRECEPVEVI